MLGTPLLSPAELFGELLHEVQVRRLFSDGKYFVDMEPLLHPAQIMSHYHRLGPCDEATLAAFVGQHFVPPTDASTHSNGGSSVALLDHIRATWDLLLRGHQTVSRFSSVLPLCGTDLVPG